LYDSSFMAMDDPYELLESGQKSGMIELPINWIADDYPYYEPEAAGSLPNPQPVCDVSKGEFEAAYPEHGMFILTTHPHITGHRSGIATLEKLILYMKSKPGVWFATLEQVADHSNGPETKAK
jgi:peptidoglycan-N-acetylglucosamine deacetylase